MQKEYDLTQLKVKRRGLLVDLPPQIENLASNENSNFIRLDDDVAAMFASAEEINAILRSLGNIIRQHQAI
jgi:hypothetical protein